MRTRANIPEVLRLIRLFMVSGLAVAALQPVAVLAQSSSADLHTVIQSSVLSDPRVANIPPAQLQGLIDALVAQASAQNMSATDILWRPSQGAATTFASGAAFQGAACLSGWQGYLCNFNRVFGFEGNNYEIPVFLLVTSAFLSAVIWEMILHHRKKMKLAKAAPAGSVPKVN